MFSRDLACPWFFIQGDTVDVNGQLNFFCSVPFSSVVLCFILNYFFFYWKFWSMFLDVLDSISGMDTLTCEERKHYLGSCRSSDFKISINYYRVGIYRWNYLVYFNNIKFLATSYYSIVRNNYILSENGLFTQGALYNIDIDIDIDFIINHT